MYINTIWWCVLFHSLSLSLYLYLGGKHIVLFLYILPSFWPIFWYFLGVFFWGFLEIDHHHNIIGRRDEMLGYILWYPSSTCIKVSACCCWDPREWCPVRTRGEAMKSKKNKNKIKHGERARVIWNRRLRLSKKKKKGEKKKIIEHQEKHKKKKEKKEKLVDDDNVPCVCRVARASERLGRSARWRMDRHNSSLIILSFTYHERREPMRARNHHHEKTVCVKWREKSAPQWWTKSYFSPIIKHKEEKNSLFVDINLKVVARNIDNEWNLIKTIRIFFVLNKKKKKKICFPFLRVDDKKIVYNLIILKWWSLYKRGKFQIKKKKISNKCFNFLRVRRQYGHSIMNTIL